MPTPLPSRIRPLCTLRSVSMKQYVDSRRMRRILTLKHRLYVCCGILLLPALPPFSRASKIFPMPEGVERG